MTRLTGNRFAVLTSSCFLPLVVLATVLRGADKPDVIDVGSRRELFVDRYLIDRISGDARLQMHHPAPREVVVERDQPCEQGAYGFGYITVLRDGDRYCMYYKGGMMREFPDQKKQAFGIADILICYAESADGIHWEKPKLGLHEFAGNKDNNIVWKGLGSHGFTPFIDTRPGCPPEERYKALGTSKTDIKPLPGGTKYLFVLKSPDGIHWTQMEGPKNHGAILGQNDGDFDSQNVAFWDEDAECYRLYFRKRRDVTTRPDLANRADDGEGYRDVKARVRDVKTATSDDCLHWSKPEFLTYPGAPDEELYTNQILPYPRAPHIYLGFPTRYVEARGALTSWHEKMSQKTPGRTYTSYTDGLLMSSRDGRTFHRWGEAFLRPRVPERTMWGYGSCYQNYGIVETKADEPGAHNELSFYVVEHYRHDNPLIRRHTLRPDGFVSAYAPLSGGQLVTKPLRVSGNRLTLNMSTSAAGSIRVEIQNQQGEPLDNFSLNDCPPLFGNTLDRAVKWNTSMPLDSATQQPIRLRFELRDADLYSFQFTAS